MEFKFKKIGTIRTLYKDTAPYHPLNEDKGIFKIVVYSKYKKALLRLSNFKYIYVIYYIHRLKKRRRMVINPSWTDRKEVGLFASRSPLRPNPIALSIVRIKKIINNEIFTSGLDVFDGIPLLDIKPYVKDLDSKCDANYGWVQGIKDYEHLLLHIKGIPHEY